MTITELRSLYTEAVRIVRAERRMRAYVFRDKPELMEAKLREIDRLLEILTDFKDEIKLHIGTDYDQSSLLDVPRRTDYP